MLIFYSAKTNAFYAHELRPDYERAGTWPTDAIEMTLQERELYHVGQPPKGMTLGADTDGRPTWIQLATPAPLDPQQVTRAQGKAALITAGLWDSVLAYVSTITDPTERALADVALNDTTHWQRSSPFLIQCATELGITEEQMDQLFVQASEIQL